MHIRQVQDDGIDFLLLQRLAEKCKTLDVHTSYTYWSVCHFFNSYSYVLMDEDEPIGYIMCLCTNKIGFIWQIGIFEEYRRRKLSYRLMDVALETFRKENIEKVQLSIEASNITSNCAFSHYCMRHQLGMKQIGEVCSAETNEDNIKPEILFEISLV